MFILLAKRHIKKKRLAKIVNVVILSAIGYVSYSCQMTWIDLDKAQILGRAGGRYSVFYSKMIALCLRHLPSLQTFIIFSFKESL